jgi:hypothetical protein
VSPELPRNVRLGQLRRTVSLLSRDEWRTLSDDDQAAVDALSLHLWFRGRQTDHPAFEGQDCIFLTVRWMQELLRGIGARKTGEKAARAAIGFLEQGGLIMDTGRTKKPRRAEDRLARAKEFQTRGDVAYEGGKDAQPAPLRSYWWRVYRVPALTRVLAALNPRGAYARFEAVPQHLASLSAFLRRQGLFPRPRRRSTPNPGSVQWVFLHSGPP